MFCTVDNLKITKEVIKNVNKKVAEIIKQDLPIEKRVMTKKEAVKFYEQEKTLKGKLQLDLKEKKEVTLYYCENYYNYFYGVLPISTCFEGKYEIMKYNNGFLIRYPSTKNPFMLPNYKETKKLAWALEEYENIRTFYEEY